MRVPHGLLGGLQSRRQIRPGAPEPDGAARLVAHGPKCSAACEPSRLTASAGDILQKMRFAAVCTLIATLVLLGAPARPAAAADPVLTAELTDFRPWLGPTNDLTA